MPSLSDFLFAVVAVASTSPSSSSQAAGSLGRDPQRIISAAQTIDKRLRRRHHAVNLGYRNDEADESSTQAADQVLPQHLTNALIEDLVISPRIVGGTASAPNRYPYLVSLTYFGSHICGGSVSLV